MAYKIDERIKAGRSKLPRVVFNALWQVEDNISQYYHVLGINAKLDRVEADKEQLIKALQSALEKLE